MSDSSETTTRDDLARLLRKGGVEPTPESLRHLAQALPSVDAMRAVLRRDRHRSAEPMQVFAFPESSGVGNE